MTYRELIVYVLAEIPAPSQSDITKAVREINGAWRAICESRAPADEAA